MDADRLKKILKINARFIDITAERTITTSILVKDGKVKEVSSGEETGIGIRMLNSIWSFASANTAEEAFDAALKAEKIARASIKAKEKIELYEERGVKDRREIKPKIDPKEIEIEEKVKIPKECFYEIKGEKKVVSSSFSYVDQATELLYLNSEGSEIETKDIKTALFASVFAKEGSLLQIGSERIGATAGLEALKNANKIAKEACEKAKLLLKSKLPPSGKFKVVLDQKLAGVFIHEALGHAVEADHVIKGESILENKLYSQIASEIVSVYDDPTLPSAFGSYFYDSEGIKAKKTKLIENGILKTYLHSRETGSKLGAKSTGNARAQSYAYEPLVRMSNTYIKPKDYSLEEMLEEVKEGVYLLGSKGGEVDPAKGVFQFSAEQGFLIKNGELKEAIRDVALSGEILQIMKNIDAVGKEFKLNIGFCGKDMQSVPVGDGGAHIRTSAVIGGSS